MTPNACGHDAPMFTRACAEVLRDHEMVAVRWFTGHGVETVWACARCSELPLDAVAWETMCEACSRDVGPFTGAEVRLVGTPEVLTRESGLRFERRVVEMDVDTGAFVGLAPVAGEAGRWLAVTRDLDLLHLDLAAGSSRVAGRLPGTMEVTLGEPSYWATRRAGQMPLLVEASRDGSVAAVATRWGRIGVVVDTADAGVLLALDRGSYHEDVSTFPVAILPGGRAGRVVHGTDWNRLDVTDIATGECLTVRTSPTYDKERRPGQHYLDYFQGGLAVSRDGRWVVDDGWIWHPVGAPSVWRLDHWIDGNPWESEDGPSRRDLCHRDYHWDVPICWLDGEEVAVSGIGDDDQWMVPGVRIFEASTGTELRAFAGPSGSLAYDGRLYAYSRDSGTTVWDASTGERLLDAPDAHATAWHPADSSLVELDGRRVVVMRLEHERT